ncbi:hypothetical protein [Imhoffiella purpurea]|uniref:Porin domain-containing protein n=1 Tax=Imhoffiella purpurea TaxID=1249627 RepID=W9VGS5_9GAMM|nr:hypothetical protein [Imhoffiella purpurea]EXJ16221.1 hypothetical protein D779_0526 [Imhoffiella purpurea]
MKNGLARLLPAIWLTHSALFVSVQSQASDSDFSLHGFGTLGIARSTDDSAELVRDLSQRNGLTERWSFETDSLFGLQANLQFHPEFEGVVQAVSRYNPQGDFKPELTWAFLSYTPSPYISLRTGRLGNEFYMLADSRLVSYSYVTVRPPIDYYGTLPFSYIDGMDVALVTPFAGGLLKSKIYAGLSREQSPWEDLQLNMSGSLLVGGYLDFAKGAWQFRLGHAGLRFDQDLPVEDFYSALPPETADELRIAGNWSNFTSLGAVYDSGPLQTQLLLSKTLNDHGAFQDTWAGYLIASYRMRDFTPFIGFSATKSAPKDLKHPLPGYSDAYQSEFYNDQRTLFFGSRWDFMENMCLKAQVDLVRGKPDSYFLYRWEDKSEWDGSMTVFSLALDFVF